MSLLAKRNGSTMANLENSVGNFIRRGQPLKEKLGPLLWQLLPNFKPDLTRLEKFLKPLPRRFSHAVELRHPDWLDPETFALLRKRDAASVWVSSLRSRSRPISYTFVFMDGPADRVMITPGKK